MLKINGGKYKNLVIPLVKNAKYRPTTHKLKEALFSSLISNFGDEYFVGKKILDLCTGTGALGIEALSRGAGLVTMIDNNQDTLNCIKNFCVTLGEKEKIECFRSDISHKLPKKSFLYDIIFFDPPYGSSYINPHIQSFISQKLLSEDGVVVLEVGKRELINIPESYNIIKDKVYSGTRLLILQNHSFDHLS